MLGNATFGTANTSGTAWQLTGNSAAAANFIGTTNAIDFRIYTSNTERMTVEANGNVGIGTTAPAYKLDVTGNARITTNLGVGVAPNASYRIYAGTGLAYGIYAYGSTMGGRFMDSGGTSTTYAAYGSWGIYTGQKGYFGGNVGIGTTAPSTKLDVNGTVRIRGGSPSKGRVLTATDANGNAIWSRYKGQTNSSSVTAGNWYRIASNSGNRANAEFTLRDFISGGGHSTLTFRAGISYNYENGMSFTVLNHNYYSTPTFTKVRILEATTYDPQYLEVYVARTGSVDYSIYDNEQSNGWTPVDWTAGSIPGGYNSREYEVNNLFVIGDYDDRVTVKRGGNVGIGTTAPSFKLHVTEQIKAKDWRSPLRKTFSDGSDYTFYDDEYVRFRWDHSNRDIDFLIESGHTGWWDVYDEVREDNTGTNHDYHISRADDINASAGTWYHIVLLYDSYGPSCTIWLSKESSNSYPFYEVKVMSHGTYITTITTRIDP